MLFDRLSVSAYSCDFVFMVAKLRPTHLLTYLISQLINQSTQSTAALFNIYYICQSMFVRFGGSLCAVDAVTGRGTGRPAAAAAAGSASAVVAGA